MKHLPSWTDVPLSRIRVIDTETVDLNAYHDASVSLHYTGVIDLSTEQYLVYEGLPPYEEDAIYVMHNASFDVPVLRLRGFPIKPGQYLDTQILAYEWDSTQSSYSLDDQASALGQPKIDLRQKLIDDGVLPANAIPGYEYRIKTPQMIDYLVQDLVSTLVVLCHYLELYSSDERGWYYLNSIAMPYVELAIEAQSGMYIDLTKLGTVQEELNTMRDQHYLEAMAHMPDTVDVWRTKKGERILKTEKAELKNAHIAAVLKVQGIELPKTDAGNDKLDKDVLAELEHPLAVSVLQYRQVEKLTSTFVSGIQAATSNSGVLLPRLCLTCTATGRLSSSEPNVQNIPARTEQGKVIRELFAAPQDYTMSVADLDRIEAVLLGWWLQEFEDDPALADVFRLGTDLHQVNADNWGISRFLAKTVLYLTMYGGSYMRLAIAAKISHDEAKAVFQSVDEGQPALKALKQFLVSKAREDGGVIHDPLGRRYVIHGLDSKDWKTRGRAERQVFSFVNQGFATSIFKELQIRVWIYRYQLGWDKYTKQILSVHDEGLYLVHESLRDVWAKTMTGVYTAYDILTSSQYDAIPVSGEFNYGPNWRTAK